MNPVPLPLPRHLDARQRAVRTFVGSPLSAVVAAVLPVVLSLAGEIRWTRTWWLAAGAAVGMAALNAGVSYALRYWKPPAS